MLAGDDHDGAGSHCDDVGEEEEVGEAPRNVSIVAEVLELFAPLCNYPNRIFQEGSNDQEPSNRR